MDYGFGKEGEKMLGKNEMLTTLRLYLPAEYSRNVSGVSGELLIALIEDTRGFEIDTYTYCDHSRNIALIEKATGMSWFDVKKWLY